MMTAVRVGLGLGMIPSHLIESELKSGQLKKISTPKPDLINKISLLRLKFRTSTKAEQLFAAFLSKGTEAFRQIEGKQFAHAG